MRMNLVASGASLTSIASFTNFPILGGYSASKSALFSLSQAIRIELADKGISVHTVNPGPIDTELASEFPADKADTDVTARNIVAGLEAGEADIFPDDFGRHLFGVWQDDYRGLEKLVADMHHAA